LDLVDDILESLRLSGGVVVDGTFAGDFCIQAEFTPRHCAPFFTMPDRLIAYHYVRSGELVVTAEGVPPEWVGPGTIIILPRNDPHILARREGLRPADKAQVMWITSEGVHRVRAGEDGPKTKVWCGFLGTTGTGNHPILDALPPLLTLNASAAQAEWLDSSMRFLALQAPSPEAVAHLAELFLAQAIREYVLQLPEDSKGWLRGLADPAVSRALSVIHKRYAEDLNVDELAREAGVSRTVLGERFVELLGEPPMRYCTRWRMRTAANMLRDGKQNTANIAYSVGFNSEAAFNRAFKREFGVPPATWRRTIEAEEQMLSPSSSAEAMRALPDDEIAYCSSTDGTRIAYASCGDGFPLVKAPNWMTHLECDRSSPAYPHWMREILRTHQLVRSDLRGFGMSDWKPLHFDFEHMVSDLAAVIDSAGIETCDLLGMSHGASIAMAYAARNPQRVRKLVLVNCLAAGWRVRADPEEIAWRKSLMEMNRREPALRRSRFGEMFITLYYPSASQELIDWHNEHFEKLGPSENIQPMIDLVSLIDIRSELEKICAPTLIFHGRLDGNVPIAAGMEIANAIAGSRFVELETANHFLLGDEPAWETVVRELRTFLADGRNEGPRLAATMPMPTA
jgi:pimeloyl-ACP methyl ester carboxylesterase/AraC-like DNA-binding protein